ncbi:hypothetical protein BDN71DRAFT_1450874 [Pleurotus eryngii]|uniref:Uncharacterized protein n=1 Tax=Pleurotus eryngii TaxID=5323 RepID=A0A9P6D6I1_PLEER|nr:hypothetical protein BDN71DRAFT_1450874 [Pleurotus eryngii]
MASFTKEDERIIVQLCKRDSTTHKRRSGVFTDELKLKTYQLKYGVSNRLANRIALQPTLFEAAQRANGIRVPELLYHFKEGGISYLVMEYIQLVKILPNNMDARIEHALWWLSSFPGDKLGPVGGKYIIHDFFNDGEAPLSFKSIEALELYIEKGRKRVGNHEKTLPRVSFKDEKLMLVQGDVDNAHFGADTLGNTVIMGFRSMSFLPDSFGRFTLATTRKPSLIALPDKFQWSGASNMKTMVEVYANLAMTGEPSLGLDDYGKPKKGVRKTCPG